jgi:HD-GYP domain-containing protein (c-di-GMP phosphodiesterase class II)
VVSGRAPAEGQAELGDRERSERLSDRLRAVAELSPRAWPDPGEALTGALADARAALRCQAGTLWLADAGRLLLRVAHNDVVPATALAARRGAIAPLDRSTIPGQVATTLRSFSAEDVSRLGREPLYDASFDQAHGFKARALLALPLMAKGELLGVMELVNPGGSGAEGSAFGPVQEELGRALALHVARTVDLARAVERLEREQLDAVCALACVPEYRDPDIRWHVRRISGYCTVIARGLGLDASQLRLVQLASTLHDIGKVGIPPSILFKPGKLTDDEFLVTKDHCRIGHQVLSGWQSHLLQVAADIAATHHERWDGGGYPEGLSGPQIPLAGRIVAVADVFDALTTRRIYKPAIGLEQSLRIIAQESTKHFDPELVDIFQKIFPDVLEVKKRFTPEA